MGKIQRIEVDKLTNDVTFYFFGSDEPFSYSELLNSSVTRATCYGLARKIKSHNSKLDVIEQRRQGGYY